MEPPAMGRAMLMVPLHPIGPVPTVVHTLQRLCPRTGLPAALVQRLQQLRAVAPSSQSIARVQDVLKHGCAMHTGATAAAMSRGGVGPRTVLNLLCIVREVGPVETVQRREDGERFVKRTIRVQDASCEWHESLEVTLWSPAAQATAYLAPEDIVQLSGVLVKAGLRRGRKSNPDFTVSLGNPDAVLVIPPDAASAAPASRNVWTIARAAIHFSDEQLGALGEWLAAHVKPAAVRIESDPESQASESERESLIEHHVRVTRLVVSGESHERIAIASMSAANTVSNGDFVYWGCYWCGALLMKDANGVANPCAKSDCVYHSQGAQFRDTGKWWYKPMEMYAEGLDAEGEAGRFFWVPPAAVAALFMGLAPDQFLARPLHAQRVLRELVPRKAPLYVYTREGQRDENGVLMHSHCTVIRLGYTPIPDL